MFTGIVEERGTVRTLDLDPAARSAVLAVAATVVTADMAHGDSVSVNGVCLTVTSFDPGGFRVDVMDETLRRTSLAALTPGSPVNLERAMPADGRFGGHIVQGHVDGVGRLLERTRRPAWDRIRLSIPACLARYIVEKGSITIDGVSLTVAAVGPARAQSQEAGSGEIEIGLIPTTLELTTLGGLQVGDPVNVEVDVLAKYTERLLEKAS